MEGNVEITLENAVLNVHYYFTAESNEDEQQLENLRVDEILTVSGDDVTDLVLWKLSEQVNIEVYKALGYDVD